MHTFYIILYGLKIVLSFLNQHDIKSENSTVDKHRQKYVNLPEERYQHLNLAVKPI